MSDVINHPPHYTSGTGVECIDAIRSATHGLPGFEAYCAGNVIKYVWRYKHKNGAEDLRKAAWYLKALINAQIESNAPVEDTAPVDDTAPTEGNAPAEDDAQIERKESEVAL